MAESRMQETTKYAPGTFCWVELGTTYGEAAKKFYTELFGWGFTDNPIGPDMVYTMLQKGGKSAGALYQMGPQQTGMPPHWNIYVAVASADAAATLRAAPVCRCSIRSHCNARQSRARFRGRSHSRP